MIKCAVDLRTNPDAIASHFKVEIDSVPAPRLNIAPSQTLGVIGPGKSDLAFRPLQWGFVPSWAKEKAKRLKIDI